MARQAIPVNTAQASPAAGPARGHGIGVPDLRDAFALIK